MKDLSIHIATVNGTGSLSANQILTRILFRSGYPLSSYNFFPSNISGLPCTYSLRLNSEGFTAYEPLGDILINLNPKTLSKNIKELKPKGILVTDEKNKTDISFEGQWLRLPLTKSLPESVPVRLKPLLKNMIYVGLLVEWLQADKEIAKKNSGGFL